MRNDKIVTPGGVLRFSGAKIVIFQCRPRFGRRTLAALGIKEYRQAFFKPYRLVYRVIGKRVVIGNALPLGDA